MSGTEQRGVCAGGKKPTARSINRILKLFESFKIRTAWRKYFFDTLRSERYRSDLLICCILGFLFFGQTRFRWFFARGSMALNSALIDLEIDAFQIVSADDHSLAAALRSSISSKREPAVTASSTER